MKQRWWYGWVCGAVLASSVHADYRQYPEAQAFIERMVQEHALPRADIEAVLMAAERQQAILDAIARPAERTRPWHEYRRIFLTEERIQQGVAFAREQKDALIRAEQVHGVPPQYILAILGVETFYGRYAGRYRVIDALTTLAFDYPPRAAFFASELEHYLLLVREQGFDPLALQGSYAGAMGYGQFISSSYRHYAVDFDGDGVADILGNPVDAIGSIANYFAQHGWRRGEKVVVPAERISSNIDDAWGERLKPWLPVAELANAGLRSTVELNDDHRVAPLKLAGERGSEYWLALNNFYVISRYNHSKMYAMAVHQLAQAIEAAL